MVPRRWWYLLLLLNVVIWGMVHLLKVCGVNFTSVPLLQVARAAGRTGIETIDCVRVVVTLSWRSFVRNCESLLQSWESRHAEGWISTCRRCYVCYTSVVILVWAVVEWLVHYFGSLEQITWHICLSAMSLSKPFNQINRSICDFSLLHLLWLRRLDIS